jgi:HPr kinase/phosphorylase
VDRITARQLFDNVNERMALRWVAGIRGETRALEAGETQARRPSLIGYLNVI